MGAVGAAVGMDGVVVAAPLVAAVVAAAAPMTLLRSERRRQEPSPTVFCVRCVGDGLT